MSHQSISSEFPTVEFPLRPARERPETACDRCCRNGSARSTTTTHRCGWKHATDPPHKRLRPRTAATARGPNSKTNTPLYVTPRDTRKPPSFAYATVCACSCATVGDSATASAAGIPVFLIRLTPALGRGGRPSCDPLRALPRRTATLSRLGDVTLIDLPAASLRRPDRVCAGFLTRPRRKRPGPS